MRLNIIVVLFVFFGSISSFFASDFIFRDDKIVLKLGDNEEYIGGLSFAPSVSEISQAVNQALWNEDSTAVILSIIGKNETSVVGFVKSNEDDIFLFFDASDVEISNLKKIGHSRTYFNKVETLGISWDARYPGKIIQIRTQAWDKAGQRFTMYNERKFDVRGNMVEY